MTRCIEAQFKKLLLVTAAFFFLSVTTCVFADSQLIAGSYAVRGDEWAPLLLSSKDDGKSWSFRKDIPLNFKDRGHFLKSLSCSGKTCVVVGTYGPQWSGPLLLKSNDAGATWSYIKTITNLPHIVSSDLTYVNCDGNTCLANGSKTTDVDNSALILVSHDRGQHWTSINKILYAPLDTLGVDKTHCDGKACVGLMHTDIYTGVDAGLISSQDEGDSWSYIKTIKNFPQDRLPGLEDVKCHGNMCVAVGASRAKNSDILRPLLTISSDDGLHWLYVDAIKNMPAYTSGHFTALSFDGNTAVAVGEYSVDGNNLLPLILRSEDNGQHWSFINRIDNLPNEKNSLVRLTTLSCQNGYCVAFGSFSKQTNPDTFEYHDYTMILTSGDNGKTWSFLNLEDRQQSYTGIKAIYCKNNSCTAIGAEKFSDDPDSPFIMTSQDKGRHWSYVKNIEGLPKVWLGYVSGLAGTE